MTEQLTVPPPTRGTTAPAVLEVRRDAVHREIRLELAQWRTRTGGVYDLPAEQQQDLMLEGHLAHWGAFLPDFVIIYATGEPTTLDTETGPVETVRWFDLRIHVGGIQRASIADPAARRGIDRPIGSAEWPSLTALLGRHPRVDPAPEWLLDLIRAHTPWAELVTPTPSAAATP